MKQIYTFLLAGLMAVFLSAPAVQAIPVTLDLTTDDWGSETWFEMILDPNGDADSLAFDTPNNFHGYVEAGDLRNTRTYEFEWDLDSGDYEFIIYDAWGDGMVGVWSTHPGSFTLTTPDQIFVSSKDENPFTGRSMTFDFTIASPVVFSVNSVDNLAPVPEPGTLVLFGIGLLGLAGMNRKRTLTR